MERADLEAIAEVLRGTDIMVISDEIYAELTYGQQHVSIANLPDMYERTIVVNGFSKSHAMTGWRMGYVCGPAPIIQQMLKLHQFGIMSAPTTSQYAAIEAMRNGDRDIERMRDEYDGRRRYLVEGLRRIGLPCFEPKGAFYVFPDIRGTGLSSDEFCERFLMEEKVAVISGSAFGPGGEGFVRCCYATSMKDIAEALTRMDNFLTNLRKKQAREGVNTDGAPHHTDEKGERDMYITCLDMEGVLVPEIWIAFAEASGIPELKRTTRDEPDYDKLMHYRLGILKEHDLGLKEIQATIATIDPLPGAKEFLDELRSETQVIILSDTFEQFAQPLMRKLDWPTLFCNTLEVAPDGAITGFSMRCPQSKLTTVKALQSIGFDTIAAGDSFNDLGMIQASKAGFLFRSTDAIKADYPELPAYERFDDLLAAIRRAMD